MTGGGGEVTKVRYAYVRLGPQNRILDGCKFPKKEKPKSTDFTVNSVLT